MADEPVLMPNFPEDACSVHLRAGYADPDCLWCGVVAIGNIENRQGPSYADLTSQEDSKNQGDAH